MTSKQAEQISDLDTWSRRTSQEHLAPTKEKISGQSSKKPQKSSVKLPLFLDLRTVNGEIADVSWQMGGALLGVYSMHSFGESPKDGVESHLSQILEDTQHPKYFLSAKACQGILNRAERRGKKLPEELEQALIEQIRFIACKETVLTERTQQGVTAVDGEKM